MLTASTEGVVETKTASNAGRKPFAKMLKLEWIGQTVASLCWIVSVFAYETPANWSTGDWLQLCAASAWFVANVASVVQAEAD